MVWIPGGAFRMGSEDWYPEERPVHTVTVDGFWMDDHQVTVAEFRRFVKDTGYVTLAERPLDPADYPDAVSELLVPGALVFQGTQGPVPLNDYRQWWAYIPGARWDQPEGRGSDIKGRERNPVTQVSYEDAEAYAAWSGKELPTEAEWEFAARGGLADAEYAWGDELAPGGQMMANTWQGEFPWQNLRTDGYDGTSPVDAFPPNGYGVHDMIGNVWEWTSDWYVPRHEREQVKACCVPRNPRGPSQAESYDPGQPEIRIPRKVLKGGSHLCAPNYCRRYRPAARYPEPIDTSTSHVGFRCIVRVPSVPSGPTRPR